MLIRYLSEVESLDISIVSMHQNKYSSTCFHRAAPAQLENASLTKETDLVEKDRRFILDTLVNGLSRLEYRGYDSAGLAVDGDKKNEVFAFKEVGKVAKLRQLIEDEKPDFTKVFDSHAGIAHTRWATHGKKHGR